MTQRHDRRVLAGRDADCGPQRGAAHHAPADCVAPAESVHCVHQAGDQAPEAEPGVFSMHPFLLSMEWRVTPLYTHWRHRPVSTVGGGCIPETRPLSSSPTEGINDHAVFCKFNPRFEALLQEYHAHLRSGNKKYQSEIDRYVVACSSQRFQHLVLPRGRVPHYDNLPDLSFYTIAIIDGSRDHIPYLQQIFLLLRQCTPLRRRTKRAHR